MTNAWIEAMRESGQAVLMFIDVPGLGALCCADRHWEAQAENDIIWRRLVALRFERLLCLDVFFFCRFHVAFLQG